MSGLLTAAKAWEERPDRQVQAYYYGVQMVYGWGADGVQSVLLWTRQGLGAGEDR